MFHDIHKGNQGNPKNLFAPKNGKWVDGFPLHLEMIGCTIRRNLAAMLLQFLGMVFRPWLIAMCTPALILVPQIFREIVKLGLRMKLRWKGADVESAVCRVSTESLGRFLIQINGIKIQNPDGFSEELLASVGTVKVSVSPWGFMFKFWTVDQIEVEDVDVWVEQKPEIGMNAEVFRKNMNSSKRSQEPAERELLTLEEVEEDDPDVVMSMLGLVSYDSATMAADKVGHLVDAAGSLVKDKKKAVEEKIKDAGGLGKFLAGGLSGIGAAIKEAGARASEKVADGHGLEAAKSVAHAVRNEIGAKVGAAADKAEASLLQQMLHRKVVGCYQEVKGETRVSLGGFTLHRLRMHASGLLSDKTRSQHPELGELEVGKMLLEAGDLVPHPKAKLQDCLPVGELLRRVKVMLSYKIRVENRASIIAFAGAGVRERVVPRWLVPKKDQHAHEYVAEVATGAAGSLHEEVAKAPKNLVKAGSMAQVLAKRAAETKTAKNIEGASDLLHGAGEIAANTTELAHDVTHHAVKEGQKVLGAVGDLIADAAGHGDKARNKLSGIFKAAKLSVAAGKASGRREGAASVVEVVDEAGVGGLGVDSDEDAVMVEAVDGTGASASGAKDKDA